MKRKKFAVSRKSFTLADGNLKLLAELEDRSGMPQREIVNRCVQMCAELVVYRDTISRFHDHIMGRDDWGKVTQSAILRWTILRLVTPSSDADK